MTDNNEYKGRKIGWVPIFGVFDIGDDPVLFQGNRVPPPIEQQASSSKEVKDVPSVGLVFSNRMISDGKISAKVEFKDVNPETICEIAIAYDTNANHLVTAG